jgi:hypothetical protein
MKRRMLWFFALIFSLMAHYCILRSTSADGINVTGLRGTTANATQQALVARLVESSLVDAEFQSVQILADLPVAEQKTSLLDAINGKDNALYELPWTGEENHRQLRGKLKGFYLFEEVDQPATPREDWEIPIKAIGAMGIKFLVVRVWISENGDIRDVDVLSSTPQTLVLQDREKIIRALLRTKMIPATKMGLNVPSQRTVEITLEP